MLKSIQAAAEKNNWEVIEVRRHGFKTSRVLVYREDAPFDKREYSTHVFSEVSGGFDGGRYDLTLTEALESLNSEAVDEAVYRTYLNSLKYAHELIEDISSGCIDIADAFQALQESIDQQQGA